MSEANSDEAAFLQQVQEVDSERAGQNVALVSTTTLASAKEHALMPPAEQQSAIARAETSKGTTARRLKQALEDENATPFGIEEETAILYQAYQRRYTTNAREFILLTGPSGTGKTFLAETTLREPIANCKDGYFITGKFDQMRRPEPFAPIVAAMTQFAGVVSPEHVLRLKKEQLKAGRGIDKELLLHMIPALDFIVDEGSSTDSSSRGDAEETEPHHKITFEGHRQRFLVTLTTFLRIVCDAGLHICLFLDDLQWADLGSLELIHMMVVSDKLKGFVLFGACRGNEVSTNDDLAFMMRSLESNRATVTEIELRNLDEQGVIEYIAREMRLQPAECQVLGMMIYRQSEGNIFFVKRYMINMLASGALFFDGDRYQWDQEYLDKYIAPLTMVELISIDIKRLHQGREEICKVAACLGASFDECLLKFALPNEDFDASVKAIVNSGLVSRAKGRIHFKHDQIQKASYGLIAEDEVATFHLALGRQLKASMSTKQLEAYSFVVASQVVRGASAIRHPTERSEMALLCLEACQKAMSLASFSTAAAYVDTGISILGDGAFRENYRLALTLFNAAAEVAYCNGENALMQERVETVLANARTLHDKLQGYTTKIVALGTVQKFQEAIDTGFLVLRLLGEPVPRSVGVVQSTYMAMKTKLMLQRTSPGKILELSAIVHQDKIAAMKILDLLFIYVFLGKPEYIPYVSCRHVQLTLQYGLSVLSAPGFSMYAIFLLAAFFDAKAAYRYGSLGLQIVENFKSNEWTPRVHASFYGMISIWREPASSCLEPLKKVYYLGQKTGDFEFAAMAAFTYCINAGFACRKLSTLYQEMLGFRETLLAYKQETVLSLLAPDIQCAANLIGHVTDPLVLTGEFIDQDEILLGTTSDTAKFTVQLSRLTIAVTMGDFRLADKLLEDIRMLNQQRTALAFTISIFYESAVSLVLYRQTRTRKRLKVARKGLKQMRVFANEAPHNFLDRVYFLEAEIAAVTGRTSDAVTMYRLAIKLAQKEGFVSQEALYYERWAVTMQCVLKEKEASRLLKRARDAYSKWGAVIGVNRLDLELQGREVHRHQYSS